MAKKASLRRSDVDAGTYAATILPLPPSRAGIAHDRLAALALEHATPERRQRPFRHDKGTHDLDQCDRGAKT